MNTRQKILSSIGVLAIIIVVVIVLSQTTTIDLALTPKPKPRWQKVMVFEGGQSELNVTYKIENSETFYIPGDEWRIRYECSSLTYPESIPAMFALVVFSENNTVVETKKVAYIGNTNILSEEYFGTKSGEVSVDIGRGNYYLGIFTLNIESWHIIVEAFY